MTSSITLLEVVAAPDAVTSKVAPTSLTPQEYGRILAGLADNIASMIESEHGVPFAVAHSQIVHFFMENADAPQRTTPPAGLPH